MATIAQTQAEWNSSIYGLPPYRLSMGEAASQSYKAGEFIYLVAGLSTVCGNNPQSIFGQDMADASETTSNARTILMITPADLFSMNVLHQATAASSLLAVAQKGVRYGLEIVSNKVYWALDETSTIACRVIDHIDAVGDLYGKSKVKMLGIYLQGMELVG